MEKNGEVAEGRTRCSYCTNMAIKIAGDGRAVCGEHIDKLMELTKKGQDNKYTNYPADARNAGEHFAGSHEE